MAANLQRQTTPAIMRAEQLQDENQQAIITPLEMGNVPLLSAPRAGAASRGNLVARDQLTVLRHDPSFVYVRVTSGALAGQHGYVSLSKIIMAAAAAPTSLRTPTTDTENAYTQLQAELAKPAPRQYEIFIIVLQRMTAAQRQRLLRPGNVEWEKITPAGRDFYNRGNGWHVTVAGDIAYFATDEIMVIDVSDKMNPVPLSTYVTPDEARHSTLANDRLYVSDWAGGLIFLGISEQIFLPLLVNP
ncbi:MAG: hypothetical protein KA314_17925 [Chloroflexi bacterium]|nr:hypothetical protein [Chloroflexota bacterium]MBP8057711.1 hypothetical protein [Chloroflexota bacterium]